MPFPAQPEALTNAWLSDRLGDRLGDDVASHEVEFFGEGAGIIGQVTRVHLTTTSGDQHSIIAKFPSPAPENRAVAATYDMYGREVGFYRNVAPLIDLRVPECYFADIDTATQDFVILMEDLQGYRIGDQVKGCSEADAKLVVEGIAGLHASTWEFADERVVSHNNPSQRDGMIAGFEMGWPVVTENFADLVPASATVLPEKIGAAIPKLLDAMCSAPVSISHADVRLDNVFFGEGEIALVDWQSVCTSSPEQDLAYFVTQSLTDEQRAAQDWVALYHDVLTAAGVNYPLEDCRARFRVSALYLVCYAVVIAGTLDMGNERGHALARTLLGNSLRSLDELDAFSLL